MRQKGFSAVEIIVVVLVVGLLGFGGWWVYQANTKPTTNTQQQSNNQISEQKEYSNAELGISFSYPKAWGNVVTEPGAPSGVLFSFSNNYSVVFGSYATMQDRSMTIYDFDGYTKDGNKYYFNAGSTKDLITPKTVVAAKNTDVLVVDNDSFDTLKNYFEVGILKSQDYTGSDTAGLVNVNTNYKGVVFVNQQKRTTSSIDTSLSTGQVSETEFKELLAAIKAL